MVFCFAAGLLITSSAQTTIGNDLKGWSENAFTFYVMGVLDANAKYLID